MVAHELAEQYAAEVPTFANKISNYVSSEEFSLKERTTTDDIRLESLVIDYILGNF